MLPVVGQFTGIRQQLADVLRDYSPDQPRDGRGRFASGGGGKQENTASSEQHHGFAWAQGPFHAAPNLNEHTMTPEQLALVLSKLNPDGATNICGGCGKITNGPHAGFVLGIQPTLSGKHINDTYCPDCMYHHLFVAYRSMGRTDQNAHALSLWIMQHAFSPDAIRQLGVHVDDLLSAVPPPSEQKPIYKDEQRAQHLRRLAAQLSVIQMQSAQVVRRAGYPLRDDKGHWAGWVGGDGTVHLAGEGKAHMGWEGVTHHSAKASGRQGGLNGKSASGKASESRTVKTEPERAYAIGKMLQIRAGFTPTGKLAEDGYDSAHPLSERSLNGANALYGSQQLVDYVYNKLGGTKGEAHATAREWGIDPTGMSHEDVARAIAGKFLSTHQHVDGPPSHMADVVVGKANDANFRPNGLHKPLTPRQSADAAHDYARLEGVLGVPTGQTTDYGVAISRYNDPQELWNHAYGDPERVFRLLTQYPNLAIMHDFINQNPSLADVAARFKRFGRNATAQEMTEALDRHFNGDKASWGRNAQVTPATEEHPFAAEYRARLAALRADAEKSGYHDANPAAKKAADALAKAISGGKGGKASGKTEDTTKDPIAHDMTKQLVPRPEVQTDMRLINPYKPMTDDENMTIMHRAFGSDQLKDAIYAARPVVLAAKARELGIKVTKTMSRDALARAVADAWVKREGRIPGPPSHFDDVLRAHGIEPAKPSSTAKTAGAGKKGSGDPLNTRILPSSVLVQPIRPVENYNADPSKPHDARFLYHVYGGRQFVTVLRTLTLPELRATAKLLENETGQKASTKTRADIIHWIIDQTVNDDAGRKEVGAALAELSHQQRATLPDLTPFARTLAAIHADLRRIA